MVCKFFFALVVVARGNFRGEGIQREKRPEETSGEGKCPTPSVAWT